jgi:DNA polymerase I
LEVITNLSQIGNFIREFSNPAVTELSVDTETSGLDELTCKLYSIQICIAEKIFVFDCTKFKEVSYLVDLISNKLCIFHNAKYDIKVLKVQSGIMLKNIYCTMITEILLNNGIGNKFYSYAELVDKYCNISIDKSVRESFFKDGEVKELTQEQLIYSSLDVQYLSEIKRRQLERIKENKMSRVLNLECRVTPILADMELTGVILDKDTWRVLSNKAQSNAKEIADGLFIEFINTIITNVKYDTALDLIDKLCIPAKTKGLRSTLGGITDEDFIRNYLLEHLNLNSHTQMLQVLRLAFGVDIKNTNEKTINKVLDKYPIINTVIKYRENAKAASSFGENYINLIREDTGRLHPDFNQLGTRSGRLSSEKPNAQNVKRESEYRDAFVPRKGYKFICADYSQQELRILGSLSQDPRMLDAFAKDLDLHAVTASHLFDKPIEDVTKDERSKAKNVNFGVVFGISEYGLFRNFSIPVEEGKRYLDDFFNKIYMGYRDFSEEVGKNVLNNGYSTTLLGRRRFFEVPTKFDDWKAAQQIINSIKRKGVNHPVQGTAGDMVKTAMVNIYYDNPFGDDLKILLQVHDELVIEVKENIAEEAKAFVERKMIEAEERFLINVPAKVSIQIGDKWLH